MTDPDFLTAAVLRERIQGEDGCHIPRREKPWRPSEAAAGETAK